MAAAATTKHIVLVTGGNGGIGYELVRQLLQDPTQHVLLAARSASKGAAAIQQLQASKPAGSVEAVELDVTSSTSIDAAAAHVKATHGRLDALVNNAGIASAQGPSESTLAILMESAYRTNVIGPVLVTDAFTALLDKSAEIGRTPRLINVSTDQSSLGMRYDESSPTYRFPSHHYRASKAALNMVTANQHVQHKDKGWKVFAYSPGFTISGLSKGNVAANGAKPTSEGAAPMVDILAGKRDNDAGLLVHGEGVHPW